MAWLWLIPLGLIASFGGVLAFGAPYLPTLKKQIELALKLTELKSGQTLLELGSGDGRVALAAAIKGYKVVGYELNPLLVITSKILTWRYRKLVKIKWANFLTASWPPSEAIFVFGIERIMPKIDAKITQEAKKSLKLVSFTFQIPDKKPAKTSDGLFIYNYR